MDFFLLLLLSLSINGFYGTLARDNLTPNQSLADNETLVSAGGTFVLGFFSPSNSATDSRRYLGIWFNNTQETVVWVANRRNPVTDSTGVLSVSADGTLTISSNSSKVVWSSSSSSAVQSPIAQLLHTGNFVVVRESSNSIEYAWQSFDYPTDTLLAGMRLGWNRTSGFNRNLTSWSREDDPSPGRFTMALDLKGIPQLFLYRDGKKEWRVGPWNGLRLVGQPFMNNGTDHFNFSFIDNSDEVYYTYDNLEAKVVARLVLTSEGSYERLMWSNGKWVQYWANPDKTCDPWSVCGPFGICDANVFRPCKCVEGFEPRDPMAWDNLDRVGGCVRKTSLNCKNGTGTDGFYVVEEAKLPDTTEATVVRSIGLDECKTQCLANCSCTGYASANISEGGSGCIMWSTNLTDVRLYPNSGQNLYVRLAEAECKTQCLPSSQDEYNRSAGWKVGIAVSAVLGSLLLASLVCFVWRRKNKMRQRAILGTISLSKQFNNGNAGNDDIEMPLFDLPTMLAATDNFSVSNKIGEGGFGPVYKGNLAEGQEIAVKRLAKTSVQGLDEFKNEVMLIVKLQHRNLVRLLGCCIQAEERMLIYEYMPNKSLDVFLFDKTNSVQLDWQTRYQIIWGIARGLLYLHQDSRFRIIHRDLKAGNILLDKDMNPKISDFGMARIFGGTETEVNTRKVVGTIGYMSPEYAMDGNFSIKSDVFSFGVIVLEIISGKRNRGVYNSDPNRNLLGHAWALWKEGRALELVDDSIGYSCNLTVIMRCIRISLLCVQERPEDRPTMASVVMMLGSGSASVRSPKRPGYVPTRPPTGSESSSSKQESSTVGDTTMTVVEGR